MLLATQRSSPLPDALQLVQPCIEPCKKASIARDCPRKPRMFTFLEAGAMSRDSSPVRSLPSHPSGSRTTSWSTSTNISAFDNPIGSFFYSQSPIIAEPYPQAAVLSAPLQWMEPNPRPLEYFNQSDEPYRPHMGHKVPPQRGPMLWPCTHRECRSVFHKRIALEQVSRQILSLSTCELYSP